MQDDTASNFYLELLRAYIDSTQDALFVLCDEMKFLLCNHAGEGYFGVSEDVLTKHNQRAPITELLADSKTSSLFMDQYPKVLAGETIIFESFMEPKHAASKWVEFNLNKVAIEDVPMVIVVARDINQRKKFEDDLENQKAVLESLVRESTNELMRANQQKDKLFTIIAHDLRTPFTPILGYAEAIINQADELTADQLRNYATKIHNSGKQSLNLLRDLLDWSRLQLDNLHVSKKTLNVKDAVQNVLNLLEHSADEKSVKLINNILSLDVFADRYILETIIRNLVSNAIKFTTTNGSVTLEIEQNTEEYIISVNDNGMGMNEDELKAALSSYNFTSLKGTGGEEGTGLGLPLCISLAEKHGGTLDATSETGKGSRFTFTINKK